MQLPRATYQTHTLPMQGHINVGYGSAITIYQLAHAVGYTRHISFDVTKPDGAPHKWMDSSRLNALGWVATFDLQQGLALAYANFQSKNGL